MHDAPGEERLHKERRRRMQVRGLLWLALVVLVVTLLRAQMHDVFPRGWWRTW